MRVIAKRRIVEFIEKQPSSKNSLNAWYKIISKNNYNSFNELRQTFPSADIVGKLTVFNISGNKFRLISAIHYNRKMVYIRHILTHSEYNKMEWEG